MGSRGRSIRLRIYFLVAVPLVTMVGLLAYVSWTTVDNAINQDRAPNLIHATSEPAAEFVRLLQTERRAAVVYLFAPSAANAAAYDAAIKATDAGFPAFKAAMTSHATLSSATPAETSMVNNIVGMINGPPGTTSQLAMLRAGVIARLQAPGKPMTALDALKDYDNGSTAMVQLFVIEADSIYNTNGATQALGLINTVAARDFLSQEDALLAGMLAAGRIPPASRAAFSQLAGQRLAYLESAAAMLTPANNQVFNQYLNLDGQEQTALGNIEGAIGAGAPISALPVTSATWQAITGKLLADNFNGGTKTAEALLVQGTAVSRSAWLRFAISSGVGALGLILTIILTTVAGRSIIKRLRRLETTALTLAENQLPDVISRLRRGDDVDVAAEAPALRVGGDEIGRVGQAFDLVRQTAIRAAVEEARLRRGLNDVFRSLARRSQSLLHRQLTLLDQMERRATDPEALDDLFRLDHLTTRMRRHAEGLVILAGAPAGRGWSSPVRMVDVMRGAIAEVEDYARVSVVSRSQAALSGSAVTDIIHLLAELIENATTLSPPYTSVRVSGETVANGFAIEVEDRGLGMSQHRLAELNERLANPPEFNPSDSEQLGLFVVGQLARRHGVRVTLKASPYGGTEAVVLIPRQLVVADDAFRVGLPSGTGPNAVIDGSRAANGAAGELPGAPFGGARPADTTLTGKPVSSPPFGDAPPPPFADGPQFTSGPRISGPMRRSSGEPAGSQPHGAHHAPRRERSRPNRNGSGSTNGNGFGASAPFPGPPFSTQSPEAGELPRRARGLAEPAQGAETFDVFRPVRRGEPGEGEDAAAGRPAAAEAPSAPYGASGPFPVKDAVPFADRPMPAGPRAGDADGPTDVLGQSEGDFKGLPRRVRQASLAPQLRGDPAFRQRQAAAQAGRGAGAPESGGPSPEEIRATMSALQRGWQEGRSQTTAEGEPPWQSATEGGADGS